MNFVRKVFFYTLFAFYRNGSYKFLSFHNFKLLRFFFFYIFFFLQFSFIKISINISKKLNIYFLILWFLHLFIWLGIIYLGFKHWKKRLRLFYFEPESKVRISCFRDEFLVYLVLVELYSFFRYSISFIIRVIFVYDFSRIVSYFVNLLILIICILVDLFGFIFIFLRFLRFFLSWYLLFLVLIYILYANFLFLAPFFTIFPIIMYRFVGNILWITLFQTLFRLWSKIIINIFKQNRIEYDK